MKGKPQQVRRTFEDTVNYQNELLRLIERKKDRNAGMSIQERDRARYIFPRSILAHSGYRFRFKNKDGRETIFPNVSSFFSQLIKLTGKSIILTDGQTGQKFNVEFRDLWNALEKELERLFPYAREEAFHTSAEGFVRHAPTPFGFSLDKKLDEE